MSIMAVAWDIDGTLIDSEPLHHRSLLAASAQFGVDLSAIDEGRFRGVHMRDVWTDLREMLPASLEFEEWIGGISAFYAANANELVPIEGALEAIMAVSELGLPQVCVSNSDRNIVDANIASLGIEQLLIFSISVNDVEKGKPDPEPYLLAARKLGLDAANIIAVEDSLTGVRAARAAGMKVAGYRLAAEARCQTDYNLDQLACFPHILTLQARQNGRC